MGVWLSWLKRCVHIAEIPGSNPGAPMFLRAIPAYSVLKISSGPGPTAKQYEIFSTLYTPCPVCRIHVPHTGRTRPFMSRYTITPAGCRRFLTSVHILGTRIRQGKIKQSPGTLPNPGHRPRHNPSAWPPNAPSFQARLGDVGYGLWRRARALTPGRYRGPLGKKALCVD
jgi:hypothetical protein